MSLERAKKYLEEKGYADHVIELEESLEMMLYVDVLICLSVA